MTRGIGIALSLPQWARRNRAGPAVPEVCHHRARSGGGEGGLPPIIAGRAAVAQLARASACHAEGRGFESHQPLASTLTPRWHGSPAGRISLSNSSLGLLPPAPWRSGYAAACKAVYTGSIPVGASRISP